MMTWIKIGATITILCFMKASWHLWRGSDGTKLELSLVMIGMIAFIACIIGIWVTP